MSAHHPTCCQKSILRGISRIAIARRCHILQRLCKTTWKKSKGADQIDCPIIIEVGGKLCIIAMQTVRWHLQKNSYPIEQRTEWRQSRKLSIQKVDNIYIIRAIVYGIERCVVYSRIC